MSHRFLKVTAVVLLVLLLVVSGVLGFVLVDDPGWFHSDSPSVSVADEKQQAIAAASEEAVSMCHKGQGRYTPETSACDRQVVGGDYLAPHLWRVVLVKHGLPNLCLNVHLDEEDQITGKTFVAAASCP